MCILIGLLAAMISLIGYGASTSYTGALVLRFLPSLFIGAPVAIKAMLGDVCDQNGQAKAMAVFTLGYGTGTVLGKTSGDQTAWLFIKLSQYSCRHFCGHKKLVCNGELIKLTLASLSQQSNNKLILQGVYLTL